MPSASHPVIHLELHTRELERACGFFERLCGWRRERIVAGRSSYLALDLGDRVGGGIVECGAEQPLWVPYVHVPEIARATARARDLGASVLLAPREGPAGWRSVVAVPAAGELAFWQPKR